MKCDKCGIYDATTHIKTVVNGIVTKKNLCSHCAAVGGFDLNPQNSIAGMLASMFGDASVITSKCPVCGSSFADIAESGKAGCASCYKTFRNELLPYLKRVHGSIKHIGKSFSKTEDVTSLREELNRLVSEERYEDAAILRDKIRELEAKGNE